MSFDFVTIDGFTPNSGSWSSVGNVTWSVDPSGCNFTFVFGTRSLILQVLGPTAFRLRYNPASGATYDYESSIAVVTRDLGLSGLKVTNNNGAGGTLVIDTGTIQIQVGLAPFSVQVVRGSQLIHQDYPGQGVLYIPNTEVIAVMKTAAPGATYLGLGEKAGSQLQKNQFDFTFFNYDNYTYATGPCLGDGGPLNPTEPLYCSIPFLIEYNPFPSGAFAGTSYACGVFLDNTAQTFANVEVTLPGTPSMSGKYYLGSPYNELDYYFFAGSDVRGVLQQYTSLTGRSPMPPRYAFGLHQGAYGYFDHNKLMAAATSYRSAGIPCDGLHIDVDFQDNYRTFTSSELKFPNVAQLFNQLHGLGFKMSTNITPIMTDNALDENGQQTTYAQRALMQTANALLYDTRYESGESPNPYEGGVNYGYNRGNNPYPYPPQQYNNQGLMPLVATGNYPDFGVASSRAAWGQQYQYLLQTVGLDMIWQDMTCPAINPNLPPDNTAYKTFPQDLMMAQEHAMEANAILVPPTQPPLPSPHPPGSVPVQLDYYPNAMVHNSYVLNLLRATWDGINALTTNRRNFIIARGGYAGMQRYAALWTGDSASSWDFLQINLPEVLNLGLSGVPISGCDIGGFACGTSTTTQSYISNGQVIGGITDYELLTRWMHLGSFLPWYRNHYDGYNKQFQEPFAYGEPVPTNCRQYVELRYCMMQVYYDAMYQWTQTGLPIARALFLNDPQDPGVYNHLDDQFFVGDDFLVAPILSPGTGNPPVAQRSVYLPADSAWYAFTNNQAPLGGTVAGGSYFSWNASLSQVPIYIRAGAILPFGELEQWVGQLAQNPLTINCYPGPDRWTDAQAYQLYQDDGISLAAQNSGAYRRSRIYQQTLTGTPYTRNIRVARVYDQYQPPAGFYYLALIGSIDTATGVTRDGTSLPDVGNPAALASSTGDAWYWNSSIQIVFVKIFDIPTRPDTTVSVVY